MDRSSSNSSSQSAVTVVPESRFMQNYRMASAVHGGSSASAIMNAQGNVELFTSATDTLIWNIYPDPDSDTASTSTQTGLAGEVIATGLTPAGNIVLFVAQGTNLLYTVEQPQSATRWSAAKMIDVPLPSKARRIAKISTAQIGSKLYLGVLVEAAGSTGTLYNLSWGVWDSAAPIALNRTTLQIQTLNAVWTGNADANIAFSVYDTVILQYVVSSGQLQRPTIAANFRTIDVAAATDSTGNTQVLAILADGNAYTLVGGGAQPFSWAQVTIGKSFKQVSLLPARPAINGLLLGTDNQLYHTAQSTQAPSGWLTPAPIYKGAQSFCATLDEDGLEVFALKSQQNTVTHLTRESLSSNWEIAPLEIQANGSIEDFASYSTDVTLFNQLGTPLVETPVQVWTAEPARLAINGSVYYVTSRRPVRVLTNAAGVLSIAQQTSALAIPPILINVPSLMSSGESIEVRQNVEVQESLSKTDGNELMNAKLANGSPLLTGQYHKQETADALAKAVNNSMNLSGSAFVLAKSGTPYLDPRRPRAGVSLRSDDPAHTQALNLATVPDQHWQLSVRRDGLVFTELSADAAHGNLMFMRSSAISAGFFDWLEDIGDFIAGVAEGIIEVVDYVVSKVVDGVQAAFHFIVDGVTYLFETVIDTVEKAFDLAESVFAAVKVFFQDLYEWLAFLFNWNDILRTHEALAHIVNTGFDFLAGAVGGIQKNVDTGIQTLQSQLQQWFEQARTTIAGNYSLGGYEQAHTPDDPTVSKSASNNIVYNGLVNNASSAASPQGQFLLANELGDPLSDFITKLTALADFTESSQAFAQALAYLKDLGSNPDQIFRKLLAALMSVVEGVLQAVLSGVKVVLDAMLQLVQTLVTSVKNLLNAEWKIPFVSDLYRLVTNGSALTTLDLVALVLAVPGTILYKATQSAAPFPDNDSVTRFKTSLNAQRLLAATGLGATSARARNRVTDDPWTGFLPRDMALIAGVLGSVSYLFYGGLTALGDGMPPEQAPPAVIGYVAYMLELTAQLCSCPWFLSAGTPGFSNADAASRTVWIYTWGGLVLDGVFLANWKRMPDNKDDIGVMATFIYGLIHLGLSIPACIGQPAATVALNVVPCIPEICKPLRLTNVVAATEGFSLPGQAALDAICYTSTTVLNMLVVSAATKPPTQDVAQTQTAILPA
jgi:hypothetical protein